MATCSKCGAVVADGAGFCGSCGTPMAASGAAPASPAGPSASTAGSQSGGLTQNVAGMLAYITIIPPILFLVMEPYNKNKFIRFHAFQSLFFQVGWFILIFAMTFIGMILAFIPWIGWIVDILLWMAIGLGGFILWIFLLIKAYNNVTFELPVIGAMAAQQAGK